MINLGVNFRDKKLTFRLMKINPKIVFKTLITGHTVNVGRVFFIQLDLKNEMGAGICSTISITKTYY